MKYKIILILLILFAIFIRSIGIFGDAGLTYDELFSLDLAHTPLSTFFHKLINTDYHPPLFYLILKIWVATFGNNAFVIHFISVCFSTFCIPVVYLIGKTIKSRNFGIYLAIFFTISYSFIYKAQEARFYQLACLEALLILYFTLKYIKHYKIKHLVYLLLAELFLLYTLTLGVLFVFVNSILLLFYVFKRREHLKTFICCHFAFLVLYLPQFAITLMQVLNSQKTLLQNPWDWIFNQNTISSLFTFLTASYLPINSILLIKNASFVIYILFLLLSAYFVKKQKNKCLNYLFILNLVYLLLLLTLTYFEVLKYSSSINYFYSSIIIQTVLLCCIFKDNTIILLTILCLQIFTTVKYIQTPAFLLKNNMSRFGNPAIYINNLSNQKLIYAPYGDKLLSKYIHNFTPMGINGDKLFTMAFSSDVGKLVFDDEIINLPVSSRHEYLLNYSISKTASKALKKTYDTAIDKLKSDDCFIILIHKYRTFDDNMIQHLAKNKHYNFPKSSLTIAKITNDINKLAYNDKRLYLFASEFIDSEWFVYVYKKL